MEHVRALIRDGRVRDVLAYGDAYGREVLPRLSAEQLHRVSAMMESAQLAVDLEDRDASHDAAGGSHSLASPAAPRGQPLPAAGR